LAPLVLISTREKTELTAPPDEKQKDKTRKTSAPSRKTCKKGRVPRREEHIIWNGRRGHKKGRT